VATAVIVVLAPLGLTLKGRTSPLVWTRRLKTVAAVAAGLDLVLFALAAVSPSGAALGAMLAFLQPLVVDAALALCGPFEQRAARKWVRTAEAKLRAAAPTTVAITGSFGKTSTKQYVRHLVSGLRSVLASPASFNNTAGLARTLNEHLVPGTEVFVAEMGTYGPGEIRSMCQWVRPDIGVMVNIGPVHLERMHTLDGIVAAKSEILEGVRVAVLNVSAHGLAALADEVEAGGTRVVRVATDDDAKADVRVVADANGALVVTVGELSCRLEDTTAQAANVAAALGVVLALDLPIEDVLARLNSLPTPEHRREVVRTAKGVTVVDNTFSSNPASATASLALLDRLAEPGARAVIVTPGMIELGREQFAANKALAEAADDVATDLVIVGLTNRKALLAGADRRRLTVHLAANRDAAVQWVRDQLTDGDVVLYENDLPDHYP
jgi:UDP-N-acetylmuramoyl-tripeptide--D-alanyl-D-alanine ligase